MSVYDKGIVDLDNMEFTQDQLILFHRQIVKFDCLDLFTKIWNWCKTHENGMTTSDLGDYENRRRYYDRRLAVLEFGLFIENIPVGRENHYYTTIRAKQYANMLRELRGA